MARSRARLQACGYTTESLQFMLVPMVQQQRDPVGSMGNDAALACLSDKPRLPYDYFKQLFAQVTNPAIDSIREEVIMSLECYIGPERNLLETTEKHCERLLVQEAFRVHRAGKMLVPIIDDAHLMPSECLRKLRLLCEDFPHSHNLVLIGQPPLLQTVSELQPLKERIAVKFNLEPLDFQNTVRYLLFRLKSAGAGRGIFSRQAAELLFEHSGGIPLRINNLCDRCLLIGLMHNVQVVDSRIMRDAIEDMGN